MRRAGRASAARLSALIFARAPSHLDCWPQRVRWRCWNYSALRNLLNDQYDNGQCPPLSKRLRNIWSNRTARCRAALGTPFDTDSNQYRVDGKAGKVRFAAVERFIGDIPRRALRNRARLLIVDALRVEHECIGHRVVEIAAARFNRRQEIGGQCVPLRSVVAGSADHGDQLSKPLTNTASAPRPRTATGT